MPSAHQTLHFENTAGQLYEHAHWVATSWTANSVGRPPQLREAIMLSTDVFTRLGVTEILNQATALAAGFVIQHFTEEAPALAFLLA